ncbi:11171_t:CDS:2, partial [Gigaspora margarita]
QLLSITSNMSSGKKIDKSNLTMPSGSIDKGIISMQKSNKCRLRLHICYAETFPLDSVPHGFYSSMMNTLRNICGFVGSVSNQISK